MRFDDEIMLCMTAKTECNVAGFMIFVKLLRLRIHLLCVVTKQERIFSVKYIL